MTAGLTCFGLKKMRPSEEENPTALQNAVPEEEGEVIVGQTALGDDPAFINTVRSGDDHSAGQKPIWEQDWPTVPAKPVETTAEDPKPLNNSRPMTATQKPTSRWLKFRKEIWPPCKALILTVLTLGVYFLYAAVVYIGAHENFLTHPHFGEKQVIKGNFWAWFLGFEAELTFRWEALNSEPEVPLNLPSEVSIHFVNEDNARTPAMIGSANNAGAATIPNTPSGSNIPGSPSMTMTKTNR